MENTITVYDAVLEFESVVFEHLFDKELAASLSRLSGCDEKVGRRHTLSHTVNAENLPIVPDDNFIEEYRQMIFNAVKESFESASDINAIVENTRFVGIKSLKTKTIKGENS